MVLSGPKSLGKNWVDKVILGNTFKGDHIMDMMKDYVMLLEDQAVHIITESDNITEALERSMDIAEYYELDNSVGLQYITDTIQEMWNELWSAQE